MNICDTPTTGDPRGSPQQQQAGIQHTGSSSMQEDTSLQQNQGAYSMHVCVCDHLVSLSQHRCMFVRVCFFYALSVYVRIRLVEAYMHVNTYTCMHVHVHVCIYVSMYAEVWLHSWTQMHSHMNICTCGWHWEYVAAAFMQMLLHGYYEAWCVMRYLCLFQYKRLISIPVMCLSVLCIFMCMCVCVLKCIRYVHMDGPTLYRHHAHARLGYEPRDSRELEALFMNQKFIRPVFAARHHTPWLQLQCWQLLHDNNLFVGHVSLHHMTLRVWVNLMAYLQEQLLFCKTWHELALTLRESCTAERTPQGLSGAPATSRRQPTRSQAHYWGGPAIYYKRKGFRV